MDMAVAVQTGASSRNLPNVRNGVDSSLSILVMLNSFQHPLPDLASGVALKETADHGP
jgi:hypothetical protein